MGAYHDGVVCRFFLVAPPPADTPSAFFAVRAPYDAADEPNMQYVDLLVQSTTGVVLAFGDDDKLKWVALASAAEASDTVMRFKIKVLVNC